MLEELLDRAEIDSRTALAAAMKLVIQKLKQHTDRSGVVPGLLCDELCHLLAALGGEAERVGVLWCRP